ncbi:hypothetical protein BDW02DRAFT_41849 [Decorospora gaudefroyi]|uniref:Uncharacterized protein n=1 Tax=Decorospora gaudefroyi TaxID=184978 RepID=A0A6A5K1V4_9PLEO|nr:hypothetical protein BDW02DRAFT_41849 [Decorospora gaudefroyi]
MVASPQPQPQLKLLISENPNPEPQEGHLATKNASILSSLTLSLLLPYGATISQSIRQSRLRLASFLIQRTHPCLSLRYRSMSVTGSSEVRGRGSGKEGVAPTGDARCSEVDGEREREWRRKPRGIDRPVMTSGSEDDRECEWQSDLRRVMRELAKG